MRSFDLRHGGGMRDLPFSLWVRRQQLAAGERLVLDEAHGDEAVFVQDGSLVFEGRELEVGGAAVIEAGASATFLGGTAGATIVHFGPTDPQPPTTGAYGPPHDAPRGVHLIGPAGLLAIEQPGRSTRFFADSACETCRITLFSTARNQTFRSASHSHSEDEILYVLDGEIVVGGETLHPNMGVAIPGGVPYGFRSGEQGFRFLNYRRDVSTYRRSVDKHEVLEQPRNAPDIAVVDDRR